ncbi:thioredoxin domain-containing protein [Maricaulis sp.]|uniref:thioredoxin domain-containing protein n=1 Tax=Maricaulis sp. TaxID=1486257 RepID=UPI003A8DD235
MQSVTRLLCGLALAIFISGGFTASAGAEHRAQAERPGDHATGSEDAPLLMVEYASFACPHCAHFQTDVWPVIRSEFVETGEVRYIFRPMLTAPPQLAAIGIVLAECADESRYFSAADLLFAEQSTIFEAAQAQGDVAAIYYRIAAAVGLSEAALDACLADPAMSEMVNAGALQANEDGIAGTPSFVIGGKILNLGTSAEGAIFNWGGVPLVINGDRVPGQLDGDTFRRIILHFLDDRAHGIDHGSETAH